MSEIAINLQLEILANNKILLPGCEPTSALSSNKLSSWLAESGCIDGALVDVNDVMASIPEATIKYGSNYNRGNRRQKWLILPLSTPQCPSITPVDWFKILKQLPQKEFIQDDIQGSCGVNDMGYCPSPDFESQPQPPKDPYIPEGNFPAGVGVLPPIPPWSNSIP